MKMYKQVYEYYIKKIDKMEQFVKEYEEFEKLKAKMEPTKKKQPDDLTRQKIKRQKAQLERIIANKWRNN